MVPGFAIGGYFGLDLPDRGDPFPAAIKFQSARAALRALLESARITSVSLPAYVCDAVIDAVVDAGATVNTYGLDDSLYPKSLTNARSGKSALLYVNYFGLCDANIGRLLNAIPRHRLIVDNSQALFAGPTCAYATIYSPRKFVGVPDGGLLMSSSTISVPQHEDAGSVGRMGHFVARNARTPDAGYAGYVESEKSLGDTRPSRMSRLTARILASIDMGAVKKRRRANFAVLAAHLDKYNIRRFELDADAVPLCYPFVVGARAHRLKRRLLGKRIYIPTYWPELESRACEGVEHQLVHRCLALPCDQRYTPADMCHIANEVIGELDGAPTRSRSCQESR
jgi:hypothetical protein